MAVGWVVLGAAVGAPARYAVSRGLNRLGGFPWGTWLVNVSGTFLLGLVTAAAGRDPAGWQVAMIAYCGAFTTYSAFALESVELPPWRGLVYTVVTVGVGLATAYAGWSLGSC